jgi:hypothetical protein
MQGLHLCISNRWIWKVGGYLGMLKRMSHLVNGVHLDHMSFSILMILNPQNCSEKWWGGGLKQTLSRELGQSGRFNCDD